MEHNSNFVFFFVEINRRNDNLLQALSAVSNEGESSQIKY